LLPGRHWQEMTALSSATPGWTKHLVLSPQGLGMHGFSLKVREGTKMRKKIGTKSILFTELGNWKRKYIESLVFCYYLKKIRGISGVGYLYLKLQLNEKMSILLSKSLSISKTVKYLSFDYFLLFIGIYLLLNKKQLQPLRLCLLASKQVLYKP